MERLVEFTPAYDRGRHGVHGADIHMILKGDLGAVQFVVFTNWHLPHVADRLWENNHGPYDLWMWRPSGADLGYHSPTPRYEGQKAVAEHCDYLNGRQCYYDGSTMAAVNLLDLLIRGGDYPVWQKLEEFYTQIFGELK